MSCLNTHDVLHLIMQLNKTDKTSINLIDLYSKKQEAPLKNS